MGDIQHATIGKQRRLTEEEEKEIYARHGRTWNPPSPPVTGRYIMTDKGMMWEEKGKVYELEGAYQPKKEEYTGEYKITRAVSSFDF